MLKRELPVFLTEDELAAKAQELVKVIAETEAAEGKLKLESSMAREDIKELRKKSSRLAATVRNKTECRQVSCAWEIDYLSGIRNLIRTDTGEIVESRTLTVEERQQKLPLPEGTELSINGKPVLSESELSEHLEHAIQ
jgi:hypothetical protein